MTSFDLSHALHAGLFRHHASSPKGHDWFEESRPLWPRTVAHLFIWNDKYFGKPLPQLAIDWEDSSADAHFFLERTPARRRNTINSSNWSPTRPSRYACRTFIDCSTNARWGTVAIWRNTWRTCGPV